MPAAPVSSASGPRSRVPLLVIALLSVTAVPFAAAPATAAMASAASGERAPASVEIAAPITSVDVRSLRAAGHDPRRAPIRRVEAGESEDTARADPSGRAVDVRDTRVVLRRSRSGFPGLSALNVASAVGFNVEPPDMGLCVGTAGGETSIVQDVNIATAIYDTRGRLRQPPVGLNAFYGLPAAVDARTETFGPVLFDPRCYFDPDVRRWFHSIALIEVEPKTGQATGKTALLLAVSRSPDPLGRHTVYRLETSLRGTTGCPCLPDYPHLGADTHGIYLTTNRYSLNELDSQQLSVDVWAMSKRHLAAGRRAPVAHFVADPVFAPALPTTSPGSGHWDTSGGGTAYFVAGEDVTMEKPQPPAADRVRVYALTRTETLGESRPRARLRDVTVRTQSYANPPPMRQKTGPTPLARTAGASLAPVLANDARVHPPILFRRRIYTAVNTAVAADRSGVAWFALRATWDHRLSVQVERQGYLAVADNSLAYPAIGLDRRGEGLMAFSLLGRDHFPSAAYVRFDGEGPHGPVVVVRRGEGPGDGFTCYTELGFGPACRWGDYHATAVGRDGRIWAAVEYIGAGERSRFANWSTFVWPIRP